MEINKFIENFAAQYDDVDASTLTNETPFKELGGWSSLTALSIIAMIDEEYDVALSGNDMRASKTIGDIISIVENKL